MKDKQFALIGKKLKHSYSKDIHAYLGDYQYDLVELGDKSLKEFVHNCDYAGYNVTIPYKSEIIPYLDEVSDLALSIGAVNTVINKDGKKLGFNTDYFGMGFMLKKAGIDLKDKVVMILGSGGTCKTATAVAKGNNAKEILVVSRNGQLNYQNCYNRSDVQVIINTTPVGMFPDNYNAPVDLEKFKSLEGVCDVVYNPNNTLLCATAKRLNLKSVNGLYMLIAQAKMASEIFSGNKIDDSLIEKIYNDLTKQKQNVILIGMPSAGKSTVGKEVARALNMEFIDTDAEIEKSANMTIPEIFERFGEEYFRKLESQVLKEVCKFTGRVIATGGGIIKDNNNLFPMQSNGKTFYLKRDLNKLLCDNRPLSKDKNAIEKLYLDRKEKYLQFADEVIDNNGEIFKTVKGVIEKL